eukprot:m.305231 g.305231  ORF g.305231 m.305231 type:complete len:78 (+) comp15906_c0_seq6:3884-4117(+)
MPLSMMQTLCLITVWSTMAKNTNYLLKLRKYVINFKKSFQNCQSCLIQVLEGVEGVEGVDGSTGVDHADFYNAAFFV